MSPRADLERANMEEFKFDVDVTYTIHVSSDDPKGSSAIIEAQQRGKPLRGPYSAQQHAGHTAAGQEHLHVYLKQNQIFSLNKDGTAHDKSHGVRIPNRVADAIRELFPDFDLPEDNLIETIAKDEDLIKRINEALGKDR